MKRIEAEWEEFRRNCVRPHLTAGQIEDFKRVFYSGAAATWNRTKALAGQELIFELAEVEMELDEFFEGLPAAESE